MLVLKFKKLREDAIIPKKARPTDEGYDVYLTHIESKSGRSIFCGTGISVEPPRGYWYMLLPRSSFTKTGYVMNNSVGVIDNTYRGELKVMLTKTDDTKPDLNLSQPQKLFQIVFIKSAPNFKIKEVFELSATERGAGAFGSTNNLK